MKVFVNVRDTAALLHLWVSFSFPSLEFCSQKKVVGQSCSMCLACAASITTSVTVAPQKLRSEVKLFLTYVCQSHGEPRGGRRQQAGKNCVMRGLMNELYTTREDTYQAVTCLYSCVCYIGELLRFVLCWYTLLFNTGNHIADAGYKISVNICAALKCCQYKGSSMRAVSIVWMGVNSVIVLFLSFWKDGWLPHIVCSYSCTQVGSYDCDSGNHSCMPGSCILPHIVCRYSCIQVGSYDCDNGNHSCVKCSCNCSRYVVCFSNYPCVSTFSYTLILFPSLALDM